MNSEIITLTDEELKQLQQKSLEILIAFKEYCDDNGLTFYLCGGSCIGAVRHGGFIPWDDDVDVFMPRPDYEKLAKNWNTDKIAEKYRFVRTTKNHYTRIINPSIVDEGTTFVKERQKDLPEVAHGVRLDILPLDGCPSARLARKMQIFRGLIFGTYIVGEPPTSKGKIIKILGKILLFFFKTPKSRYKIWNFAENKMKKYEFYKSDKITELYARYTYMVNEYPAEAFKEPKYAKFEGHDMPLPTDYNAYLTSAFGDYRSLPPEHERYPKHDIVKIDLQNSYKKYFCKRGGRE